MQEFVGISLKTRLYLLVLIAFVPVSILIYFVAKEQRTHETQEILRQTMVLAKAAANEENQQLESTKNLLEAVFSAFQMVDGRRDRLHGFLVKLLQLSKGYEQFGMIDHAGRVLASSDTDRETENYSDKSWLFASLQTEKLVMGQYRGEQINGEPVLFFALSALDNGMQTPVVVFAAVNLNWMNRSIFKRLAELPKGSQLTLMDETQGMLSYNVDSGRWNVPANINPALHRQSIGREPGTLSAFDENRIKWIYAFAPLNSTYRDRQIFVMLQVPEALALSTSKRNFTRNIFLLAISALIAVLCIWWAGDFFILRRLRAMARVSRELAAGNLNARIGNIGVRDELSHLAVVFDEMATALQARIVREEQVMVSLEQSREQLRRLATHQQAVREQERRRIAREIHDQFGQSLTILKLDLSWIKKHMPYDPSKVDKKIDIMSRVIDDTLNDLHAVTAELRPVVLDDFGLAAAIEWQIDEFSNRSGIACRLDNNGFEPDLPKDQAIALFRIFQETLTNILRHAQADEVVVRLEALDGDLILQVQDNGRGITDEEMNNPKSLGLLGMRERLYPWNGHVLFEGRPSQGTHVTIRIPMRPEGANQ